jgi:hypothetical protein
VRIETLFLVHKARPLAVAPGHEAG